MTVIPESAIALAAACMLLVLFLFSLIVACCAYAMLVFVCILMMPIHLLLYAFGRRGFLREQPYGQYGCVIDQSAFERRRVAT